MRPSAPRFLFALLGLPLALACGDYTSPDSASPDSTGFTETLRPAFRAGGRSGFDFNGSVGGLPGSEVRLTGGGSFDPATAANMIPSATSVAAPGGFDCTTAVTGGPLTGCATGEGVRWDSVTRVCPIVSDGKSWPAAADRELTPPPGSEVTGPRPACCRPRGHP